MTRAFLPILVLLTSCSDDRPPAPTAEESDQLNEVEALLNREAENQEGPEERSSDPSD